MTPSSKDIFNRAELLLGADVMERLASVRVILFGVGGVGSWCARTWWSLPTSTVSEWPRFPPWDGPRWTR